MHVVGEQQRARGVALDDAEHGEGDEGPTLVALREEDQLAQDALVVEIGHRVRATTGELVEDFLDLPGDGQRVLRIPRTPFGVALMQPPALQPLDLPLPLEDGELTW